MGWWSQYRGDTDDGHLRLYQSLDFEIFYSDLTDFTPPLIQSVSVMTNTDSIEVTTALAEPASTVYQVIATHTASDGRWDTTTLDYDESSTVWRGSLPLTTSEFVVQVADSAGNVTIIQQGAPPPVMSQVYLPLVAR
jgi:hypothetical protein